jgi:hypothetical protein
MQGGQVGLQKSIITPGDSVMILYRWSRLEISVTGEVGGGF